MVPDSLLILEQLNTAVLKNSEAEIGQILANCDWENLLTQESILECRLRGKAHLVIFLCTLAVNNGIEVAAAKKWLAIYQSIQSGKLVSPITQNSIIGKTIVAGLQGNPLSYSDVTTARGQAEDWVSAFELALDSRDWETTNQILMFYGTKNQAKNNWHKFSRSLSKRHYLYINKETRLPVSDGNYRVLSQLYEYCRKGAQRSGMNEIVGPLKLLEANVRELAGDYDQSIALISQQNTGNTHVSDLLDIARCECRKGDFAAAIDTLDQAIQLFGESSQPDHDLTIPTPNGDPEIKAAEQFDVASASIALADLANTLQAKNLKGFLVSGTLLGYCREGKLLDHDKDIDIGIIGWENQYELSIALQEDGKFSIYPYFLKGKDTHYMPIRHTQTGMWIDVFFYHRADEKLVTGVDFFFGYRQTFAFTPFNLKSVRFLNVDMYIPENSDLNLTENFGDWRTPDASYISHLESPSTVNKGGLEYMLTARINTLDCILKRKSKKLQKIAHLMQIYSDHPCSMSESLINQIQRWALAYEGSNPLTESNTSAIDEVQYA